MNTNSLNHLTPRSLRLALLAATGLFASSAGAQTIYVLSADGTSFRTAPTANPAAISSSIAITGVTAGETLVAIDVRPQNQQLYTLGVNATANTATLYCLSPQTGVAGVVGTVGSIAYTTDGATPVDFPDASTVGWDIDFNPAVDRLRIVAGSLNCRVDPNSGAPVDGNNGGAAGSVSGVNPDGAINGGTTTVSATAYVNSQPNNGGITTQYTLDAATNVLFIQNPPNNGTQVTGQTVTLGGDPLDFSGSVGFDIAPGVNAASSNAAVTAGSGFTLLTVDGTTGLYAIDLVNAQATFAGAISGRSIAIRQELGAAIALDAAGPNLIRFSTTTPGTTTTVGITGLTGGETLAGIDFRPQTGQFYALGVNAAADTATLYRLDPQTGTLTVAVGGTTSGITFAGVDFPNPATAGYGIDFNPTVDRLRVVTNSGLNFRVNPNTGLAVSATPDGALNGLPGGSTGVSATAYTNSFGQSLVGGVTTQYTLDAESDSLFIQNPPNNGVQTATLPVTLGDSPLDFNGVNGFDIPSAVRVAASNNVAAGEGWLVTTVGGTTGLYRLDLATGAATSLGSIGAGSTPLAGLTVFTTPCLKVQDFSDATLTDNQDAIDFGNVGVVGEIQGNTIDDDGDGIVDEIEFVASTTITVSNTGSQPLTYSAATTSTEFSIANNASGVVPPGGSAEIEVTVSPSGSGAFDDTLTITTNDPANAAFDITLKADAFLAGADDAAVVTTGDTRVNPLANDGLGYAFTISAVSDSAITIAADGRTLIIPASFGAGSFTYTASDGTEQALGTVNVTLGTPVVAPVAYSGLLFNAGGEIIGSANVALSAKGVATVQILGGTGKASTKITVATVPSAGANFTPLGYTLLTRNVDGTLGVSIAALGGNITGTLLPAQKTATAAKHHIALTGGGYAIATVSTKGLIKITGLMLDGVPFSAASVLRDNNSFAFYTVIKGPKPPNTVGGELTVANLAKTDVSGALRFVKLPQLPGVKGLYLSGVDAILAANGSLYDGTAPLPNGNGTLTLTGGDLAANESNPVVVSAAGIPTPAVGSALKTWTGVKQNVGKFSATVAVPGITKPVKASGLYLPKSNSAWGFFPGNATGGMGVGGTIELTVP